MPFKKSGKDYVSPAGNTFTKSEVHRYYAGGGRYPGQGMREQFPTKERVYGNVKEANQVKRPRISRPQGNR